MARKLAAFVIPNLLKFEQIFDYGCSDVWHYPLVMLIRSLVAKLDFAMVREFYAKAPDYWQLVEGKEPFLQKARDFFTDTPPNCDPKVSLRLDLFLGLMVLGPWAWNRRNGKEFLRHIEEYARRQSEGEMLFLAVLDINSRGRAFSEREGFSATGFSRAITIGDIQTKVHKLAKSS